MAENSGYMLNARPRLKPAALAVVDLASLLSAVGGHMGEQDGFYLINRRIKATFEHPFLVHRDEEWGFCSAELLRVGDYVITLAGEQLDEERIDTIERIDGRARTVAIYMPGTNTYLADGVWTHNDLPPASSSDSTGGISISVSGTSSSPSSGSISKSSGPSFSSSSDTVNPSFG